MYDQRVETGPLLGGENLGDGVRIAGVGAQSVDGLGGEGDNISGGQRGRGAGDRLVCGGENRHVPSRVACPP